MITETATCASCARPRAGRYCSHCGEEFVDPHALTVRHFVAHTLAHETASAAKSADLTSVAAREKFHTQLHKFAQPLSFSTSCLIATVSAILIYLVNSAFVTGIQMLGGALALWSVSRPAS